MLTYTGRKLYPQIPEADMVDIRDIAHGLSLACRFGGQCNEFYSVAQHCVVLSEYVGSFQGVKAFTGNKSYAERQALRREVLMHDATEAYYCDLPSPVKALLPQYKVLEGKLDTVIRRKCGLPDEKDPLVKELDTRMAVTELRALCGPTGPDVEIDIEPLPNLTMTMGHMLKPWKPKEAEQAFLTAYRQLFEA